MIKPPRPLSSAFQRVSTSPGGKKQREIPRISMKLRETNIGKYGEIQNTYPRNRGFNDFNVCGVYSGEIIELKSGFSKPCLMTPEGISVGSCLRVNV